MAHKGNYKTFLRSQDQAENGPSYIPSRKIQLNRVDNYGSGSPKMKHWKSYLAPQLTRPNGVQYSQQYQQLYDNSVSAGRYFGGHQLQGARSLGQLQDLNRLDQRSLNPIKNDYSRRKDEIMNRIKALQEKTSTRDRRQFRSQSQNQMKANFNDEDIESRVSSLQARMDELQSQFQSRIEKAIMQLQERLNLR